MELHSVTDITCGHGFTIFAVNDTKTHLFGTGLNKDGQIGNQNETDLLLEN
jgi:alpha-tubulin suppressor-like RCC1 family protein